MMQEEEEGPKNPAPKPPSSRETMEPFGRAPWTFGSMLDIAVLSLACMSRECWESEGIWVAVDYSDDGGYSLMQRTPEGIKPWTPSQEDLFAKDYCFLGHVERVA